MLDIRNKNDRALTYALAAGIATVYLSGANGALVLLVTVLTFVVARILIAVRS